MTRLPSLASAAILCALASPSAFAQSERESSSSAAVPNVATEIVIEGLTLQVKTLRIGVALSPKQIEDIVSVFRQAGAEVTANTKDEPKE